MSAELPQPEQPNPLRRVLKLFTRRPASDPAPSAPTPSGPVPSEPPPSEAAPLSFPSDMPLPPPPLPRNGKKILLVDDDPVVLRAFSFRLRQQGYDVVTATDGSKALGAVRDKHPDLILLDVGFPPDIAQGGRVSWDGFQIMYWMRGLQEAGNIPFIVISAGDAATFEERALKAGAVAFYSKSSDFSELLAAIQNQLKIQDSGCNNPSKG